MRWAVPTRKWNPMRCQLALHSCERTPPLFLSLNFETFCCQAPGKSDDCRDGRAIHALTEATAHAPVPGEGTSCSWPLLVMSVLISRPVPPRSC